MCKQLRKMIGSNVWAAETGCTGSVLHTKNKRANALWRTIEALSWTHCHSGKAKIITQIECVCVALGIQHAMRLRRIVTCGLHRSIIFFPYYFINGTVFLKKWLNIKCVFRFSLKLLFETFIILRTKRDMIKNVMALMWSNLDSFPILTKRIFSIDFRKILIHKISRKSVQCKPNCPMSTDGRTGMTTLIVVIPILRMGLNMRRLR
jgi:hypothetical protein